VQVFEVTSMKFTYSESVLVEITDRYGLLNYCCCCCCCCCCCTFHVLRPLTCSDSELTFETVNHFTYFGRVPWTGDRAIARPLTTNKTTQHRNIWTYIHASKGIRTHARRARAIRNHMCLRPRGHAGTGSLNRIIINL